MGLFDQNTQGPTDPGTYAAYMAANPNATASNGTDYTNAIAGYYGANPGSFEDWSYSKDIPSGMQESERDSYLKQQYDSLLNNYQQGQSLVNSQYNFAPDQKLTTQQLNDLGMNLTPFQGYDKQNAAWANDPMGNTQMFVQNSDGTYTPAVNLPKGLANGYKTIQVNKPAEKDWTDVMDTAITIASALGAGVATGGAAAAALAPEAAGAGVGAAEAAGSTGAGSIDAYMGGAGLDAGSFGSAEAAGATLNPSSYPGADAILNAPDVQIPSFGTGMPSGASGGITAPLEGSGAIPGAGATTLGEGGLTGALPANVMVGDGTLGTTIGATYASSAPGQFALDASGAAIPASSVGIGGFAPSTGLSLADVLKTANQVKQGISTASTLAKLLGGSGAGGATGGTTGGTATPTTGGLSQQQLAQYLSGMSSPVQAAVPGQIKMNQNPFTFDIPGQTQASQGMYDVSGVHPMANALRKL